MKLDLRNVLQYITHNGDEFSACNYRNQLIETLQKKLYVLRDIDGNPNTKAIDRIREVEQKLTEYLEFIGIALRGSITRGYSREESDLDFYILYDSSPDPIKTTEIFNSDSDVMKKMNNHWRFQSEFTELWSELNNNETQSKKQDANFRAIDISPYWVWPQAARDPDTNFLANIFRLVTGRKIGYYRQYYINRIKELPEKQQKYISMIIAYRLAEDDSRGWEKMVMRVSGIQKPRLNLEGSTYNFYKERWYREMQQKAKIPSQEDFQKSRQKLWQKHLEFSIFNFKNQNPFYGRKEIH